MKIFFSDLDGTLLNTQTYSFEAAKPALEALRQRRIPLVFCTSKTRAEVELWRTRMENQHPFIVENGGAVYIPRGYFPFTLPGAKERDGYEVVELGTPYEELVEALRMASREADCQVRGFNDMGEDEVSARCLLPAEQARLAKMREYDEPFEIESASSARLLRAIEQSGKQWTRGDRFYHILGNNDKATAMRHLMAAYRVVYPEMHSVGLGDGHNDAEFLAIVDTPLIVRSRFAGALKMAVPRAVVTHWPGPEGWNEAVLGILDERDEMRVRAAGVARGERLSIAR